MERRILTATPSRGGSALILACVVSIAALAWAGLFQMGRRDMADIGMVAMGMTGASWTGRDALLAFAMWVVMMAGMMIPSAAPVLMLFAATQNQRGGRAVTPATAMFGAAYFAVWTGFSAAAALAQWGLHQAAMLTPAMAASDPRLAGAILISAGVYQLTPWKGRCLSHCRSPLGFLMSRWREGAAGAFRMGLAHGAYCLGCCWALMGVLFVVGVMNLAWVAALTAFVLLEKTGPGGMWTARIAGAALVVSGAVLALRLY